METFLEFVHDREPLPERFRDGSGDDVRTPEPYVEHFLEAYTDPGDAVVDPFAGFGTTLRVAERLGRAAYGLEYERDRVEYVRGRVDRPGRLVHGSALELPGALVDGLEDPPAFDCCLTSPPYMVRGMRRNPLANYADDTTVTYDAYLDAVTGAFEALEALMAPDGHVLVDVANLKYGGRVTRLAFDLADRLAPVYPFEGEVVIGWETGTEANREESERERESDPASEGARASDAAGDEGVYGYGYDHSYCLVFGVGE